MLGTATLLPGAWVLLVLWVYFTLCESVISSTFLYEPKREMDQKSYSNLSLVVVFSVLEIRYIIWMGSLWYSHEKHYHQIIRSPSKFYAYLFNKLDMHLQWSALSQSRGSECKYWHHFGDHVLITTTQAILLDAQIRLPRRKFDPGSWLRGKGYSLITWAVPWTRFEAPKGKLH